jgi:hypothetical protein
MLLAVMAVVSCSKFDQISDGDESRVPVQLYGVINDTDVTRGDGVIDGKQPSSALNLDVFRADMNANKAYETTYTEKLNGPNTMAATTGAITLNPKQYYLPDGNRNTKYIAVYPTGGTYSTGARTITYTLNGTQDVMCSGTVEGSRSSNSPLALKFNHLLTKLQVEVKANGADKAAVKAMWGNITSIKVKGRETNVELTLPDPYATAAGTVGTLTAASNSSTTDLELQKSDGTSIASTGVEIPDNGNASVFGYAMFLPFSSKKLTLEITTEKGGTKELETTNELTYDAGKGYKIVVAFALGSITIVTTGNGEMEKWDDQTTPENVELS